MGPRQSSPMTVSLPITIGVSILSALVSGLGAWFALKNDVSNVVANNVRIEKRVDRVETALDNAKTEAATRTTELAIVVTELRGLNSKIQEANDHLGRIEERQVKIIVPAVSEKH